MVVRRGETRGGLACEGPRVDLADRSPRPRSGTPRTSRHPSTRSGASRFSPPDIGRTLAERQVLDHQVASRAHGREESRQEGYEEAEHRAGEEPGPVENRQRFQRGRSFDEQQELWTASEVARYLKTSSSWGYQATASGRLPSIWVGHLRRFEPAKIRAWATSNSPRLAST